MHFRACLYSAFMLSSLNPTSFFFLFSCSFLIRPGLQLTVSLLSCSNYIPSSHG